MGGKLSVTSEFGIGRKFTATVPFTLDILGSAEERERRRSVDFSAIKALVVCADRYLDDHIETLFKEYNIQSESVSSPSLATKVLESGNYFDLVVIELADSLAFPTLWQRLWNSRKTSDQDSLLLCMMIPK
jgi:hypothetical protein